MKLFLLKVSPPKGEALDADWGRPWRGGELGGMEVVSVLGVVFVLEVSLMTCVMVVVVW